MFMLQISHHFHHKTTDLLSFSSDIYCSTRSRYPVSSWSQPCVTSSRRTHSLEVRCRVWFNVCLYWHQHFVSLNTSSVNFSSARKHLHYHLCKNAAGWWHSVAALWFVFTGKRPFGVSLLYMGWDKHYGFQLYQSDPSGNYGGWKATCIGNNSAVGLTFLEIMEISGMIWMWISTIILSFLEIFFRRPVVVLLQHISVM